MLNSFDGEHDPESVKKVSRGRSSLSLRAVDVYVVTALILSTHGKIIDVKRMSACLQAQWEETQAPYLHY